MRNSLRPVSALCSIVVCLASCVLAASPASDIHAYLAAHEAAILDELVELLKIPNLASDHTNIRRNAEAVADMMRRRGLSPRLLEPHDAPDAPPLIYGEWKVPKAKRTLVLYAHYDGQPLDPKEWATPPWQPVLRDRPIEKDGRVVSLPANGSIDAEWRIYAR